MHWVGLSATLVCRPLLVGALCSILGFGLAWSLDLQVSLRGWLVFAFRLRSGVWFMTLGGAFGFGL